jgi:hypothetical protein
MNTLSYRKGFHHHKYLHDGYRLYESLEELSVKNRNPHGYGRTLLYQNAIIDKNCRMGDDVENKWWSPSRRLGSMYVIRSGIVVIKRRCVTSGFHNS